MTSWRRRSANIAGTASCYSPGTQQTTLALFYNTDMLEKAGIALPPRELDKAWTWTQAMAAFKKCQQGEGDDVTVWGLAPSRFGTATPGFVYRDMLFLRTQGDPKAPPDSSLYKTYWGISPDGKMAQGWLNTPEAIAGAKFFQDMFSVAQITPKAGIPNAFQDGRACFTIDTSYFITGLVNHDPGFKWGVTPLPYSRTPIVHTGSLTYGVMAKTTHKDEAAKFVRRDEHRSDRGESGTNHAYPAGAEVAISEGAGAEGIPAEHLRRGVAAMGASPTTFTEIRAIRQDRHRRAA